MTDQEYAEARARIRALHAKWVAPLGLKWWLLHLEYAREGFDSSEHPPGCLAFTRVSWEYLEATITFNMPQVLTTDAETVEDVFVHEACHILVREMRDCCDCEQFNIKHEERVCTTLAKAFLWTYKAGEDAITGGVS